MVAFKDFDLVNSFCLDYMHNITLGVLRSMILLWTNSKYKKKDFYISKNNKAILDSRLLSMKKCSFIALPPRSLKKLPYFKSNELRNLLLYYLRNSLVGLLPQKYIDHFQLLSSSIYQLLKTDISPDDLSCIENKLTAFVSTYQSFYGKQSMTMNVHLILHYVENVKHNGPLWSTSMFSFESNNGQLLKLFNGYRHVLRQITSKYILNSQNSNRWR